MAYEAIQHQLQLIVETIKSGIGSSSEHGMAFEQSLLDGSLRTPIEEGVALLEPFIRSEQHMLVFDDQMHAFASGWARTDLKGLARSIIIRATATSPGETLKEVAAYFSNESYPVQQVLFLSGISVDQPIEINDEIKLLPFENGSSYLHLIPREGSYDSELISSIQTLAIKQNTHPRVYSDAGSELKPVMKELWDFSELEDLVSCASLFGPCGPAIIATSIAPVNWLPCHGGPIGQCPSATELRGHHRIVGSEANVLKQTYQAFAALPRTTKNRLRVPMRRLNLAMRRRWDVDVAIDIGIALGKR